MPRNNIPIDTTGLPGLDRALTGVWAGDNIVWNAESAAAYARAALPFAEAAARDGRPFVYFRCGPHPPLLPGGFRGATVVEPAPADGFETFLHRILDTAARSPRGTYYLFDCLSGLDGGWCTDAMLVNFFRLVAPALRRQDAVACYGLLRGRHSYRAIHPIQETVQVFLEAYGGADGPLHISPLQAAGRTSASLHLMLRWDGAGGFAPVLDSATAARILSDSLRTSLRIETYGQDLDRQAETLLRARSSAVPRAGGNAGGPPGTPPPETPDETDLKRRWIRLFVTRDDAILPLVERYFTLEDLWEIRSRTVGTGLIGGKAVGMLLARQIAAAECPELRGVLEPHDSFYIGSDVFCSYLVRNGLWDYREKQRSPDTFLDGLDDAQALIWNGKFAKHEVRLFEKLVDYFGPYPLVVRSSSLLEDNYGNSFAGKYESVFCASQGTREERLRDFMDAIRAVYASAMSAEALRYRERNGLLGRDEQMALLVMRVNGSIHGRRFYPPLAGVGFSWNPFCWDGAIDPAAGVLRLVFGLGTRAVDRVDDDYTRVVALNAPLRRPEGTIDEILRHAQRKVDFIDLDARRPATADFDTLAPEADGLPMALFAERTEPGAPPFLLFDGLLSGTPLVGEFRTLLTALERVYGNPVDTEFTVSFSPDGATHRINLLQCRPLHVRGTRAPAVTVPDPATPGLLLAAAGAVVGHSRVEPVDWILYVVPEAYAALPDSARHRVARAVGAATRALASQTARTGGILAIAPGRWGSRMATLGVPVNFSDISPCSAICELARMHDYLAPDVSLGTHFFGELVETNLLYFALAPGTPGNLFNEAPLLAAPDHLSAFVPGLPDQVAAALRLVRADALSPTGLYLVADSPSRRVALSPYAP